MPYFRLTHHAVRRTAANSRTGRLIQWHTAHRSTFVALNSSADDPDGQARFVPRPDAEAALLDANYDGEAAMLTVVKMLAAIAISRPLQARPMP